MMGAVGHRQRVLSGASPKTAVLRARSTSLGQRILGRPPRSLGAKVKISWRNLTTRIMYPPGVYDSGVGSPHGVRRKDYDDDGHHIPSSGDDLRALRFVRESRCWCIARRDRRRSQLAGRKYDNDRNRDYPGRIPSRGRRRIRDSLRRSDGRCLLAHGEWNGWLLLQLTVGPFRPDDAMNHVLERTQHWPG